MAIYRRQNLFIRFPEPNRKIPFSLEKCCDGLARFPCTYIVLLPRTSEGNLFSHGRVIASDHDNTRRILEKERGRKSTPGRKPMSLKYSKNTRLYSIVIPVGKSGHVLNTPLATKASIPPPQKVCHFHKECLKCLSPPLLPYFVCQIRRELCMPRPEKAREIFRLTSDGKNYMNKA